MDSVRYDLSDRVTLSAKLVQDLLSAVDMAWVKGRRPLFGRTVHVPDLEIDRLVKAADELRRTFEIAKVRK